MPRKQEGLALFLRGVGGHSTPYIGVHCEVVGERLAERPILGQNGALQGRSRGRFAEIAACR
jgi:hypothetical protein